MTTARHTVATQHPGQPTVDDLQHDIHTTLGRIAGLAPMVALLTDSTQRSLPFLSHEGREHLDRQARAERRERRTQPVRRDAHGNRMLGLEWLNRTATAAGTGEVAAPGNWRAIATDADIWFTLRHQIRHVTKTMEASALTVPAWVTSDLEMVEPGDIAHEARLTVVDLVDRLEDLCKAAPSPRLLRRVLRDLDHCADQADVVVNGAAQARFGDCPICEQPTLIYFFRDELMRCDRAPGRKNYQPCRCADPLCGCHEDPVVNRHEWHRARNQLQHLANRLTIIRAVKEPPTMSNAQAHRAIAIIRALHRPFYVTTEDDREVRHDNTVYLGAEPPAGHVCRTDGIDQCTDTDHYDLACIECRGSFTDNEAATWIPWPCPTTQALEPPKDTQKS